MTSRIRSANDVFLRAAPAICCLFSIAAAAPATLPTQSGQWWESRGDRRLTARSTVKGNITKPAVLWKHRVAAREALLTAKLDNAGRRDLKLPDQDLLIPNTPRERVLADLGAAHGWYDVDS